MKKLALGIFCSILVVMNGATVALAEATVDEQLTPDIPLVTEEGDNDFINDYYVPSKPIIVDKPGFWEPNFRDDNNFITDNEEKNDTSSDKKDDVIKKPTIKKEPTKKAHNDKKAVVNKKETVEKQNIVYYTEPENNTVQSSENTKKVVKNTTKKSEAVEDQVISESKSIDITKNKRFIGFALLVIGFTIAGTIIYVTSKKDCEEE